MASETVIEKAVTKPLVTYIDRRQATVEEWVALRPILKVCDREIGYEGRGRLQEPWWRKTAARKQLSATLKNISAEARERRWNSGRRAGGGGDRDIDESEDWDGRDGY